MTTRSELVQKNMTMAIATDPPNKFRRCKNQNMYRTYEHKKKATHSELETEKDLRWLWPLTPITNPEDAEIQTVMRNTNMEKRRHTQNWGQQRFTMAMANDPQTKSRRC